MAPAAVQRISNAGIGTTGVSIGAAQGWATPSAGNLLVITVNLDVTMSTPAGWLAGPSVVDDNAAYSFYKISAGTESTIAPTYASTNAVLTAGEYSGITGTPFDVQNSSTIAATPGTATTSTSVTTSAAGDLIIAVACLYDFNAAFQPAPTSPSWTNSFVNVLSQIVNPGAARHGHTFVAELIAGAAGAYATAASWSSASMEARHQLVIAFKATAGGTAFTRTVDDAVGLTDAASAATAFARTVTDGVGLSDTAAAATTFARTATDSAGLTDAATAASAFARTQDDTAGLTDTAAAAAAVGLVITDTAGLTDTAAAAVTIAPTITDTAGITDTVQPAAAFARTIDDTAGLTDSRAVAQSATVSDGVGLTDARALAQTATVADSAGLTDATSAQLAAGGTQQVDDSLGLTDAVTYSSTQTRTDTLGLVDVATLAMVAARAATDVLGLTDSVTVALTRSVVVSDSAGLTDSVTAQSSSGTAHTRTVTDSIGLTSWHVAVATTHRLFSGVTARPSSGTTARPDSGMTQRYPSVPD